VDEARAAGQDEPDGEAPASARYDQALQGVSAIIAPATLLTGIAFYFGWKRVAAFDEYFGLNPGAVGYSTRDYVLNSLDALFLPVIIVLVGLMALAFAHAYIGRVHRAGQRPEKLRQLSELFLIGGLLLLVVGALGAFGAFPFHTPYLIATLFPAAGVLLIAHAVDLRAQLRGEPPLGTGARVLVALFVAICLFWAAGLYAGTVGRNQAVRLAHHLAELPAVSVSSASDPALTTGSASPTGGGADPTIHTYNGLRLLTEEHGTMFLLSRGWTAAHGTLFTVPESDVVRIALTPATAHNTGSLAAAGADQGVPVVSGSGPKIREIGPLHVVVSDEESTADVYLHNRTGSAASGVSVSGVLAEPARPIVTSAKAFCREAGGQFVCRMDAIPPKGSVDIKIAYRGGRTAHGTVKVGVGSARGVVQIKLKH